MTLHIKNMVCDRCIMAVRTELDKQGLNYSNVQLGEVELAEEPGPDAIARLRSSLEQLGFELLDDRRSALINQAKSLIIRMVRDPDGDARNKKLSVYLSEQLGKDYHALSNLFSATEGVTIERFVILQRIERVKELLRYDEMSLNDISFELGYSSVQHLSQQFKKVTGMTPTEFKNLREGRKPLDKL